MPNANDVYKAYVNAGGLAGISSNILTFLRKSWRDHDYVKKLFKECVDIYKKAFPTGRPPKTVDDAIRRVSIFAATLGRLRRIKSPRAKEIEKYYRRYRSRIDKIIRYRDSWNELSILRPIYSKIVNDINRAKNIKDSFERVSLIYNAIENFYNACKKAREITKKYGIRELANAFKNCSLGNLWFKFTYALTVETGDQYWMQRTLEIHVITSTHAELLFDPMTDEKLSDIVLSILDITDNSWLLSFSELRGFPFEFESKQLLSYRKGIFPKTVDFKMTLFDHNYNFERIRAYGRISSKWHLVKTEDILKMLDIETSEVRGVRGRSRKELGRQYKFTTKIIDGKEVLVLDKILEGGEEKDISKFIAKKEIKYTEEKNET
ncbi:MAG: hypothetical protein QXY16_02495 [Nanopusillaceae archaeon]